jgi:hypothetical protein
VASGIIFVAVSRGLKDAGDWGRYACIVTGRGERVLDLLKRADYLPAEVFRDDEGKLLPQPEGWGMWLAEVDESKMVESKLGGWGLRPTAYQWRRAQASDLFAKGK